MRFQAGYQVSSFAAFPISFLKNRLRGDARAATMIIWPFHSREPGGTSFVVMPVIMQK
jgi:hypothetical protein